MIYRWYININILNIFYVTMWQQCYTGPTSKLQFKLLFVFQKLKHLLSCYSAYFFIIGGMSYTYQRKILYTLLHCIYLHKKLYCTNYSLVHKVSEILSTETNYSFNTLFFVFVNDRNKIIYFSKL